MTQHVTVCSYNYTSVYMHLNGNVLISMQKAQTEFYAMLDQAKQKLARAYKKFPFMIERTRPFFDLREKSLEAKEIMYSVSGTISSPHPPYHTPIFS